MDTLINDAIVKPRTLLQLLVTFVVGASLGAALVLVCTFVLDVVLVVLGLGGVRSGIPPYISDIFMGVGRRMAICALACGCIAVALSYAPPLSSRSRIVGFLALFTFVFAALIPRACATGYLGKELIDAINDNNLPHIKQLVHRGADIESRDQYDGDFIEAVNPPRAVVIASERNYWDIVSYLLDQGANPNARGRFGETLIIRAAANGQLELVKKALSKGADLNAKDETGRTALSSAKEFQQSEVEHYLEQYKRR